MSAKKERPIGRSGISRQAFLRGAGALSLGLSIPGFDAWNAAAIAQEVRPGGLFALNLTGDPPNFDPISNTTGTVLTIIAPCYNGLVVYDPADADKIIGDLAESWEVSPDGKALTFKLVRTAKFHDGKPMTSADVKASFDIVRNPPAGLPSPRKGALAAVTSIETPDDYTVRFVLKQPSPSLLANLAGGWMVVMPKHILDAKGSMKEQIVGTGPFMMKGYSRGVSVELVKNPNYHVKGRPYLDGLKAFIVPDTGTTMTYLKSGQLHMFQSIQGQDAGILKTTANLIALESPSTSYISVNFNTRVAPFNNLELRKAATLAIDREAALKVTGNGQGGVSGAALPGQWALPAAELEKIPGYGRDVAANQAEAKRILAQQGFPNGFPVKLLVRRIALFEPVGVFVKDQWAKVGINATLDIQENASYFATTAKGDFQADASGSSYPLNDPDAMFADQSGCGDGKPTLTCDMEVEDLFTRQSQTLDPAERRKLVNQLELILLKKYNIAYLFWRNRYMGLSAKVKDMKLHPNIDNNMRMQNVWLSA